MAENDRLPPAECGQCHTGADHRVFAVKTDSQCTSCHEAQSPGDHAQADLSNVKISTLASTHSQVSAEPNPMVMIPAGEFVMGSDERLPDEGPQQTVNLDTYWIDVYEVTNAQYKKFIAATERRSPAHFTNRIFPAGKGNHPVTEVTWVDAQDYCTWAGKRLPTDQEWEKAARGTDGRMYPWGNELDINKANTPMRWASLKQAGATLPVGSFPGGVSPYGLYDMSGNVWEWTSSWYQAYPGNTHPSENYGEQYKTLKGGSWWDCSFYQCGISAPSFNRAFFMRGTHNKSFGFRCARDAEPVDRRSLMGVKK